MLLFVGYTAFTVFDWYIRLNCLVTSCTLEDGGTEDLQMHYVHYDDVSVTESSQKGQTVTWMVVIFLCWLSATLTLLVVWLIDLRPKASSFILMIRNACLMQICMDIGYFLLQFYMALGLIDPLHNDTNVGGTNTLLYLAGYFAVMGDTGTVLWTNVICFVFVILANHVSQNKTGIDIGKDLWKYTLGIFLFSSIVAILDVVICMVPTIYNDTNIPGSFSDCPIVRLRCVVVTCSIMANIISTIYVKKTIFDMDEGIAKDKLEELSNRMFFYPIFVAFTRIAYLYCGYSVAHFGVDFAGGDPEDQTPMNYFNTINYLLWLPAGTGFAIFYLYTHPAEFNYFCEICKCNKDAHFLPNEIWELVLPCYLYVCSGYHVHSTEEGGDVDEIRFQSEFISLGDIPAMRNRDSRATTINTINTIDSTDSNVSNDKKATKNPILGSTADAMPERESNTRESQADQLHYLAHTIVRIDSVSSVTDSDYDQLNTDKNTTGDIVEDMLERDRVLLNTQQNSRSRGSEPPLPGQRLNRRDDRSGRSFSADDANNARRLFWKYARPSTYHKEVFIDTMDDESTIFENFVQDHRDSVLRRSQMGNAVESNGTTVEMMTKKPTAQGDMVEL